MAIGWIDYGPEYDLMWICLNDSNGECWTWPNPKIKAQPNVSFGRPSKAE